MIVSGDVVVEWIMKPLGGSVKGVAGIGWVNSKGNLVSGFAVENWNGVNCFVHQRQEGVAPRSFWFAIADWVFNQLGCKRLTAPVAATNIKAIRLNEHIGLHHEATLTGAAKDGSNLILMVLWREDCRMLNWNRREANPKGKDNEQKVPSTNAP